MRAVEKGIEDKLLAALRTDVHAMCVGPVTARATVVGRRDPRLLKVCSVSHGQHEQIPLYAEALRKCAADVLDGDLKAVPRMETFSPGFSFAAFSDASDMDYFLKCNAPRPSEALTTV